MTARVMEEELRSLRRKAAAAGIETRYHDAWGNDKEVPPATLRALLETLGVAGEAAAPSLLAPVTVLGAEEAAPSVELALPAGETSAVEWLIALESGDERRGAARPGELSPEAGRRRLALPAGLPEGYHRLVVRAGKATAEASLIVAPARCYLPPSLGAERIWGLATQLYALRSRRNWGMGDFTDLAALGEGAAGYGAAALGLNPLHALFPVEPRHISPYSPSSRLFLNPLYLDVEAVPEFATSAEARALAASDPVAASRAAARRSELVDHAAVAAAKRPVLEALYRAFRAQHLGPMTPRGEAFRRFQHDGGRALARFALFEALQEHAIAAGHGFSWRAWPAALRDPSSDEVARFAAAAAERIEFFQYLQWESDRQLGEAARRGCDAGLAIGLYRDLAVGVDPSGGEAWSDQELLVTGAAIGAPPDLLNLKGQNWGLAPLSPVALRRRAYAPFVAALRANMRHAGALRIDHVMALQHLYWIPAGAEAADGAYLEYPIADLLRLVALESRRNRCLVIGEDLGTVPTGFRERASAANILSYRVLIFERRADGSFAPPSDYPALAAASVATHDLPTLKGYWLGRDIDWRERLDLYPNAALRAGDRESRARERRLLLDALIREGVLPEAMAAELLPDGAAPVFKEELVEAVHRYLARSPARLVLAQIEDAVGESEQANLPGTFDEHPNWRRKLARSIEEILADDGFARLASALNEERARSAPGSP